MTIREFVDRLMLELGDIKGEKLKHSEYFVVATEALKTVEAVYRPLTYVYDWEVTELTEELLVQNPPDKKLFNVERVSVDGSERYYADYSYVKLGTSFMPVYSFKVVGNGVLVAFAPAVPMNKEVRVIANYIHTTNYFANEANELELGENYILIALNLAKQYLYTKYGAVFNVQPPQQFQQTSEE